MPQNRCPCCNVEVTTHSCPVNRSTGSGVESKIFLPLDDTKLLNLLNSFLLNHPLPGLGTDQSRKRFVHLMSESWKEHSCISTLSSQKFDGFADPSKSSFNYLFGILENYQKGKHDEAIWLAFLSIHFGLSQDTIRLFYGKFGEGLWDWQTVSHEPEAIHRYMQENRDKLGLLKFGNHRKYESNDPKKKVGTPNVIHSFIDWVNHNGSGSPHNALLAQISLTDSYEHNFDRLYRDLRVIRFGRTAKFDLLSLLGKLNILPIKPGHCYLRESTGPLKGAMLMVTGNKQGQLTSQVENEIMALQNHLGAPSDVFEDALCNWQK